MIYIFIYIYNTLWKEGDEVNFNGVFDMLFSFFPMRDTFAISILNNKHCFTILITQVASHLEASHKLQEDILTSQNQSLHNQEMLMHQAYNLKDVINSSSDSVRMLFEDLKVWLSFFIDMY